MIPCPRCWRSDSRFIFEAGYCDRCIKQDEAKQLSLVTLTIIQRLREADPRGQDRIPLEYC